MRAPEALLIDIAWAADRLASYIEGMTREEFVADNKTKAAVVREIEVIGEAANRLPPAYRAEHPEVPGADLARLRNLYIHVYERIRYDRVWTTATRTIPVIASTVATLVPAQPAEEPSARAEAPDASPGAP